MKKLHAIRIAFTLWLIVTILAQSMVAATAPLGSRDGRCRVGNCGDQHAAQADDEACGCCQGKEVGGTCCCCDDPEQALQASRDCGVGPDVPVDQYRVLSSQLIKGICLCGLVDAPMDRGPERQRVDERSEQRNLPASTYSWGASELLSNLSSCSIQRSESGNCARFSQRLLCVWRI